MCVFTSQVIDQSAKQMRLWHIFSIPQKAMICKDMPNPTFCVHLRWKEMKQRNLHLSTRCHRLNINSYKFKDSQIRKIKKIQRMCGAVLFWGHKVCLKFAAREVRYCGMLGVVPVSTLKRMGWSFRKFMELVYHVWCEAICKMWRCLCFIPVV